MSGSGLVLILFGVWVAVQVTGGHALERLGVLS